MPHLGRTKQRLLGAVSLVHAHSIFVSGSLARLFARRRNVPLILSYHTQLEAYAHYGGPFAPMIAWWIRHRTRRFANAAQAVFVATATTAAYLRRIGVTTRIDIIANSIDAESFSSASSKEDVRRRFISQGRVPIYLCVARLAREKNLDFLLQAFAKMRRAGHLLIAGDGPQRKRLEARAHELEISQRVTFLGQCDRAELLDYYGASDCFVFSSTTETQGLVLAEALCAGLPLIMLDTPQGREIAADTDTLFIEHDSTAFAHAMDTIDLNGDESARNKRRARGRSFGREAITARVVDLYRDVIRVYKEGLR